MQGTVVLTRIALLLLMTATAWAADFEKGLTAYDRGDYATAFSEWRPLAEQGNPDAQYNLGVLYDQGQGVPQDESEAAIWYRRAAAQGDAVAQAMLASMYDHGRGVPQDSYQAMAWYRQVAKQGIAIAQYHLARLYEPGQTVPKDHVMAYVWLDLAAAQRDGEARKEQDRIARQMTPFQLEKARQLSQEYDEKYLAPLQEVADLGQVKPQDVAGAASAESNR